MIAVEGGELAPEVFPLGGVGGDAVLHGGGLERLAVVDAVGLHALGLVAAAVLLVEESPRGDAGVFEIFEAGDPVEALLPQKGVEVEELGVGGLEVEPLNDEGLVLPSVLAPVAQGARGHGGQLVVEVGG